MARKQIYEEKMKHNARAKEGNEAKFWRDDGFSIVPQPPAARCYSAP